MNSYDPLISIIAAVYNGAHYLEGAIKSIVNQEYKNYEIIIIDGGSSDGTCEIIKQYINHIHYTISEKDAGIYDAWNKGLKEASGDWVVFIGADDILYPYAFKTYINYINQHPEKSYLEFVSSKIELIDDKMNVLAIVGEAWNWPCFRERMNTWHVGTFHSSKLFKKYGLFDINYKVSGDYEFLLRPKNSLKAGFLPIVTVRMRNGGVSAKLLYEANKETYKAKVKNGILPPLHGLVFLLYDMTKIFLKKFNFKINFNNF